MHEHPAHTASTAALQAQRPGCVARSPTACPVEPPHPAVCAGGAAGAEPTAAAAAHEACVGLALPRCCPICATLIGIPAVLRDQQRLRGLLHGELLGAEGQGVDPKDGCRVQSKQKGKGGTSARVAET